MVDKIDKKNITKKKLEKKSEKKVKSQVKNQDENRGAKFIALFLLILMIFSVIGFAMLGTAPSNTQDVNEEGIPRNLPLQQIVSGEQIAWVATKNYELFIFEDVSGFDQREDISSIAFEMKQKDSLNLFLDDNFTDSNLPFVIEQQFSNAFQIPVLRINDLSCDENTLVLTNNINKSFDGSCLVLASQIGEEEFNSMALSYHLIRDE